MNATYAPVILRIASLSQGYDMKKSNRQDINSRSTRHISSWTRLDKPCEFQDVKGVIASYFDPKTGL